VDVLLRVIPFFLLVAVGAVVARAKLIDIAGARALSAYVFWVAFPALLIHSLSHAPPPNAALGLSLAAYGAAMLTPLLIILLLGRLLGWSRHARAGAGMVSVSGNTAFLGAPLAVSLFGAAAAIPAAAVVAVDCTLIMAIASGVLRDATGEGSLKRTIGLTATNPLVVAALVGLAMSYAGVLAPGPIDQALATLRATASPVGLTALGVVVGLEFGKADKGETAPVLIAVAFKVLLAPVLVFAALTLVGAAPMFRTVATLLAACPTAVNVFIQTRTLNVFARGAAMAVVLATIATVVSLPLLGAWLGVH
jgi:malonate transporter